MAQKTHLAITACAGGRGCGDSILEDEIGDDDFREVSGDKTDPDWSMIKRTFEAYIRGIPVGNTSIIWTHTCQ